MTSRRLAIALVVAVVGVVLVAVIATRPGSPRAVSAHERAYRDTCGSVADAEAGDPDGAARRFADRVHGPLHTLAAAAADVDRATAARLLEAKGTAEDAVDPPGAGTSPALTALAAAVRDAVTAVEGSDPGPC